MSNTKRYIGVLAAAGLTTLLLVTSGCKHEKPNTIYMPDMFWSPAYKAQEEGSMRPLPKGTVPRGFVSYPYGDLDAASAGPKLTNPIPRTRENLVRGQTLYNTYCIVCHGPYGEGDGPVSTKGIPRISLQSDKVRAYVDGSIYHVMTAGQGLMSSYASQVAQEDRWKIVHYIRALHRSRKPTPEDLRAFEQSETQ